MPKKTATTDTENTNTTPEPSTPEPTPIAADLEPQLDNPNGFHALTIDEKVKHLWERDQWKSRQLEKLTGTTPAPAKEPTP